VSALTLFPMTTSLPSISLKPFLLTRSTLTIIQKKQYQIFGPIAHGIATNWHNLQMEMDATINGQICIAQKYRKSKSGTHAKSRAKVVVLMEFKIKEKKASTAEGLASPAKLQSIANGVIGNMESAQRRAEEVRERIIERNSCISQTEEWLALVQLGKPKNATLIHVLSTLRFSYRPYAVLKD